MHEPNHVARTLQCPSCGAAAPEGKRHCDYCRAPIATMRCSTCFHLNISDAVHCSGCGRELGLEPIGEHGGLVCPACKTSLERFTSGAGALHDCGACGGQFVEQAMLRDLLEQHEKLGVLSQTTKRVSMLPAPVRYLPCPSCSSLMNRKNFGGSSGVVVDVCKKHGIWFDPGELPRVLAFVASGGLEHERQRHAAEEAERKRAEIAAAAAINLNTPVESGRSFQVGTSFAATLIDILLR